MPSTSTESMVPASVWPGETMTRPEVRIVTPSYAPDFELFRNLHASVLRFTDASVTHEVIVPRGDRALFETLGSDRLQVTDVREFLPRGFVSVRSTTARIARWSGVAALAKIQELDTLRPWLPVRGWILQQVVKLGAAARASERVVLCLDSDLELIASVSTDDFRRDGTVRLFCDSVGVTSAMPDHLGWHATARSLLGLSAPSLPPLPDHISGMVSWDPILVRDMLDHIATAGGKSWVRCITSRMVFSEDICYGTYVTEMAPPAARMWQDSDSRCASHWDPTELTSGGAADLLASILPTDVAVQVQSTSFTSDGVRRALIDSAVAKVGASKTVTDDLRP